LERIGLFRFRVTTARLPAFAHPKETVPPADPPGNPVREGLRHSDPAKWARAKFAAWFDCSLGSSLWQQD